MNIKIEDFFRGDTLALQLKILDDQDTPVDVSAFDFWVTFKTSKSLLDTEASLQAKFEIGNITSSAETGEVLLIIDEDLTSSLLGQYFWDIQIVSGQIVRTIGSDVVTVKEDITRNR